ncbi:hypothetical protein D3C76_1255950 [compost metagenome]
MFVRRRVINSVHTPRRHDIEQLVLITHGSEDGQHTHRQRLTSNTLLKLRQNRIQIEFAVFEQQKRDWVQGKDLTAKLRTD